MKKTKQAACILLSLILLLGLFPPVRVQASGTVTISVSSSTVKVGDTVTVTAWAAGPNGEEAVAKLGFNYDSGKFSFVSCSQAEYSGGSDGYVGVTGNNVSITLKATATGTASVTVSGSGGTSKDGGTEFGELSAGGTKLTIQEGAGGSQQEGEGTDGAAEGGADNANKSGDNSLSSLSISPGTLSPSFQYSETNYTASVAEDVTSVTVNAKPSNEKATVESITGQSDLKPGQNTVSVVVKAENGATATYKIVVTRGGEGGAAEGTQETPEENQGEPTQGTSGGITINGHPFDLAATIPDEIVPKDFTKTSMACQGQQVEGLQFDKAALYLVYLTTPSTEVKNTLAVYDEASGTFYPFRKVEIGEKYMILLNPPAGAGPSEEYTQSTASIEGFEGVPVFVSGVVPASGTAAAPEGAEAGNTDGTGAGNPEAAGNTEGTGAGNPEGTGAEGAATPEGTAAPEFSLVYGASSAGNMGWYQYDAKDGFFQRYVKTAVQEPAGDPDAMDSSAELESIKNSYKDLEEQLKETKGSSRRNTAIMVFLIAVLIVVIVNLILRARSGDEEEEDFFDAPPRSSRRSRQEKAAAKEPKRREHKRGRRDGEELKKLSRKHSQEDMEEPEKPGRKRQQDGIEEPGEPSRRQIQEEQAVKMGQRQAGEPGAKPAKNPEPWEEIARQGKKLTQETRAIMNKDVPKKTSMPTIPKAPPVPDDDFEVIDLEDL